MGKTRDGDFNQLYQQNDNIMSSVTLDHVQPISKTIEVAYSKGELPGVIGISEIIAEVSAQSKITLKSSDRPWNGASFKRAVFEHSKMDKTLALLVKSDLEKIKDQITLELMQQSENSGKGNRN